MRSKDTVLEVSGIGRAMGPNDPSSSRGRRKFGIAELQTCNLGRKD
jgi:hypothetical protein